MTTELTFDSNSTTARPTMVRYGVLFFLCTLALLLYVDRVCIGQAAGDIKRDLGLNDDQMSWVYMAFTLAYCLFEVPTGHWGDRYGSRGVITRIVIAWSIFTALTGAAAGLISLMLVRFLFGVGEAGAFPNAALVITKWFPVASRGKVRGLITTVSLLGGAAAPIVSAYLIQLIGWRYTFCVFGAVGVVWAAAFYVWFRDRPSDHAGTNEAERRLIESEPVPVAGEAAFQPGDAAGVPLCPMCGEKNSLGASACEYCGEAFAPGAPRTVAREGGQTSESSSDQPDAHHHDPIPWGIVLTSPNMWLLGGIMMVSATLFYMQFQWYPTYLKEARGQSMTDSGWLTACIMLGGAMGCISGGVIVDALIRRTTNRKLSRRLCGGGAMLLAAASAACVRHTESAFVATLCNAFALFFLQISIPTWWTVVAEISGKHGASMWGLMNSMGGLGVLATTKLTGWFVSSRKAAGFTPMDCWTPVFDGVAILLMVGAVCWLFIDPTKSIVERRSEGTEGVTG